MTEPLRVVHYVNQFFGGIGGEEAANIPPQLKHGPVGPGRALEKALLGRGIVEATVVCGDNFFAEEDKRASAIVREQLLKLAPEVVVAGPAFDAGRYGYACGRICMLAWELGIPSVTAMHPENPGYTTFARYLVCLPTGSTPRDMPDVISKMADVAVRLAEGAPLGPAQVEGYLPTGVRRPVLRDRPAWQRAVEMLEARVNRRPYQSEVLLQRYEPVLVRPPGRRPRESLMGLITSGGLVPRGNPDRQVAGYAERAFRYSIEGLNRLTVEDWESVHGGFNTRYLNSKNPNYVLPLPVLRELEKTGEIKALHPQFFSTVGNGTSVSAAASMGREIASVFKSAGVSTALAVAT